MNPHLVRNAVAKGGPHDGEEITCESYGNTIDAQQVWWIPETHETFLYSKGYGNGPFFRPYDGPIIHGTGYTF